MQLFYSDSINILTDKSEYFDVEIQLKNNWDFISIKV